MKLIQLNEILELAKTVYNTPDFKFNKATYYGQIWLDVMECLKSDGEKIPENITRKIFKVFIVFDSVKYLMGTKAYFNQSFLAWEEKVRNLFEANNEEEFDCLAYEFYVGSFMSMDGKLIYFCNMNTSEGKAETKSLCEYFIDPRLFIECKNLFGITKNTIDNNIRKANKQLRSTMNEITVDYPIGATFLDLSEEIKLNDRNMINGKIVEALHRLRQCSETHFLIVTYMNVVSDNGTSDSYSQARLIVNPLYKDSILTKENLLLFHPRFRMVSIPNEDFSLFDVYDFIDGKRLKGISFDKLFCI